MMLRGGLALLVLGIGLSSVPATWAGEKTLIRFDVTSEGLKTKDIQLTDKRMTLPAGTRVKLVFDYADRHRNAHQFSLVSEQTEIQGGRMSADGPKRATIEFTVGDRGEKFYRLSCDLPCIAMESLTDYIILVDRPGAAAQKG